MNEPQECLDITKRFFEALDAIKEQKRMRGMQTFTQKYGENYRNFHTCRKAGQRIKQEWLTYLVRDYSVSAKWLLTGQGNMFSRRIKPREKHTRILHNKESNDPD